MGSVLESSGFIMANLDRNGGIPGIPQRGRLTDGDNSGTLKWAVDTVPDAWEYEYCLGTRTSEGIPIEWGTSQKATQSYGNMLTGLTPGVIYHVRVRAHNGKGDSDWCEPFSRMARRVYRFPHREYRHVRKVFRYSNTLSTGRFTDSTERSSVSSNRKTVSTERKIFPSIGFTGWALLLIAVGLVVYRLVRSVLR